MSAVDYLRAIGWRLYEWQDYALSLAGEPTMILSCRQGGKTFAIGGKALHTGRSIPRSLSVIVCPDQDKSKTMISRVSMIAERDPNLGSFEPDNTEEKGLRNGSIIRGLPGTIKGVVSHTAKLLIFDEAALIPRALYDAATPMQAAVTDPWRFAISSAWWKQGWFWDEWSTGHSYRKILVMPRWQLRDGDVVPAIPESEFRAMWKERGVVAFYSPTPTKEYLEFELSQHPEAVVRQQYWCEFLDMEGRVFNDEWIRASYDESVVPLVSSTAVDEEVEPLEAAK